MKLVTFYFSDGNKRKFDVDDSRNSIHTNGTSIKFRGMEQGGGREIEIESTAPYLMETKE
jgi:hypothetical protein